MKNCWYPLGVAVLFGVGTGLSISSTLGCDFVRVSIGFVPVNPTYNSSSLLEGGLWRFSQPTTNDNAYCESYSVEFEQDFIQGDLAWRMARIMAWIAGSSAASATLLAGAMVGLPKTIPPILWYALLLPLCMIAVLAEGFQFLLLDVGLCRNPTWWPSGVDSDAQAAESCRLGTSGGWSLAAATCFLLGLILVCLHQQQESQQQQQPHAMGSGGTTLKSSTPEWHRRHHRHGMTASSSPDLRMSRSLQSHSSSSRDVVDDLTTTVIMEEEELPSNYSSGGSCSNCSSSIFSTDLPIAESRLQALERLRNRQMDTCTNSRIMVESFVQDVETEFR